jgi:hypothetical protein
MPCLLKAFLRVGFHHPDACHSYAVRITICCHKLALSAMDQTGQWDIYSGALFSWLFCFT